MATNKNRRLANTARATSLKSERGCLDCGEKHPAVLQFHHRESNADGKRMTNYYTRTWGFIEREIAKCDVLCANCHLKRHHNEKSGFFAQMVERVTGE